MKNTANSSSSPLPLLGILSACAVVFIWSGWVVSSRWGITGDFSPVDLTWVRFTSASLVLLPFSLRYPWRNVPWKKALVIALGCGFPYVWLVYIALTITPSANASVLINGFLPIVTSILAFIAFRTPVSGAVVGLFIAIFIATGLMAYQPIDFSWRDMIGILLLITATAILATYMLAVKAWAVSLRDIMAWVPLLNAVILLPFWLIYSDGLDSLRALPVKNLAFHIVYQGIIVSVLALFLFSYAIKQIGAFATSLFMALVPSVTAILALIFCAEYPSPIQWAGIFLCSTSLIVYSLANR